MEITKAYVAAAQQVRCWTGTVARCYVCGDIRSDQQSERCEQCKREGR